MLEIHCEQYDGVDGATFSMASEHVNHESQLIKVCNDFAFNLDNRSQTDVVILNFKIEFNKVDHCLLIYKLTAMESRETH